MQLQWATRNIWTMDALRPYIGAARHRWLYPARSLHERGAALAVARTGRSIPYRCGTRSAPRSTVRGRRARATSTASGKGSAGRPPCSCTPRHRAATRVGPSHGHRRKGEGGRSRAARPRCDAVSGGRNQSADVRMTLMGGTVVHDAQSSAGRAAAARVTRAAAGPRPTAYASVHGGRHASCGCG